MTLEINDYSDQSFTPCSADLHDSNGCVSSSSEIFFCHSESVASDVLDIENEICSTTLNAVLEIDNELMHKDVYVNLLKEETIAAVGNLHASHLFLPAGKEALTQIYRLISATPDSEVIPSWRDLAAELEFDSLTIFSIKKTDSAECLDIVLKTYCTKMDATLANLVNAFYTIKRYDCLQVTADFFPAIAKAAAEYKTVEYDKQIPINGSCVENFIAELKRSLPTTYQDVKPVHMIEAIKTAVHIHNRETDVLVQAAPVLSMPVVHSNVVQSNVHTRSKRKYLKRVLLSFTSDGQELAMRVTEALRSLEPVPFGVLILGEHIDKVYANPFGFITHQVHRMDYVIPIVTEGYLEALGKRPDPSDPSLDSKFVQLIHDTLAKDYVDNGCRNMKVRCILPNNQKEAVLRHPHFKVDPLLKVYFSESMLNPLIEKLANLPKRHCIS